MRDALFLFAATATAVAMFLFGAWVGWSAKSVEHLAPLVDTAVIVERMERNVAQIESHNERLEADLQCLRDALLLLQDEAQSDGVLPADCQ